MAIVGSLAVTFVGLVVFVSSWIGLFALTKLSLRGVGAMLGKAAWRPSGVVAGFATAGAGLGLLGILIGGAFLGSSELGTQVGSQAPSTSPSQERYSREREAMGSADSSSAAATNAVADATNAAADTGSSPTLSPGSQFGGAAPGSSATGGSTATSADDQAASLLERRLEEAAARFRNLRAVYHPLHELPYDHPTLFNLTIASADLAAARAQAAQFDRMNGAQAANQHELITRPIPLSSRVEAVLDGDPSTVSIAIQGPHDVGSANARTKDVTSVANVSWVWSVTPKTTDDIVLTLSLYNVVNLDGVDHEIDGPVYTDTFRVHASIWDRLRVFIQTWDPVATAIKGVIVAVVGTITTVTGWNWWKRRKRRRDGRRPVASGGNVVTPS